MIGCPTREHFTGYPFDTPCDYIYIFNSGGPVVPRLVLERHPFTHPPRMLPSAGLCFSLGLLLCLGANAGPLVKRDTFLLQNGQDATHLK